MRQLLCATLLWAFGCAASAPPSARAPRGSQNRVAYCSATVTHWDEDVCIRELTRNEQRRSAQSYRLTYEQGRLVEFASVNGRGELVENESTRCAVWRYSWEIDRVMAQDCRDAAGLLRARTRLRNEAADWLDAWGRPQKRFESEATGLIRTFDARGRVVAYRYVDAAGLPVPNRRGVFEVRTRRDQVGQLESERFFGKRGEPILSSDGYHRVEYEPNGFGGRAEERYFDIQGRPTRHKRGYHRVAYIHDAFGNVMGASFYGTGGEPAHWENDSYYGYRYKRDARGERIETQYLNAAGTLVDTKVGYAIQRLVLDERGRVIETRHFDSSNRAVTRKEGNHGLRTSRDKLGDIVRETFFDLNGAPVATSDGWASVRFVHDARRNEIRREYYGAKDERVLTKGGFHARELVRDRYDQVTEISWVGTDDRPVDTNAGYALVQLELRRSDGEILKRRYFTASGTLAEIGKYALVTIPFTDGRLGARSRDDAERLGKELKRLIKTGASLEEAAEQLGLNVETVTVARHILLEPLRLLEPGATSDLVPGRTMTFLVGRRDD